MFKRLFAAFLSVAAALLPGCDVVLVSDFTPGKSTAPEVRQRMGPPSAEYANDDGGFTWEYNRQPNGIETHMLTFGQDRILRKIDQVLSDEFFRRVTNGMGKDEIQRLLGKPGSSMTFPLKKEEVWDWRIAGTIPNEEWHFHVHFDVATGLVVGTSRMMTQK